MGEYLLYRPGQPLQSANELPPLGNTGNDDFYWLDMLEPTRADLQALEERLSIHPLTIEDVWLRESREKCEYYDGYIFLALQWLDEEDFYGRLRTPRDDREGEEADDFTKAEHTHGSTSPMLSSGLLAPCAFASERIQEKCATLYMLVMTNALVSIHWGEPPFLPSFLQRRLPLLDVRTRLTGDWLAYGIVDECVDEFTRQTDLLQSEVDTIEDLTLSLGRFDQTDMLRRIYQAHRRTTILSRLIQPKIDLLSSLTKRGTLLQERTIIYLRDVSDHLQSIRTSLLEFGDSLDRAHGNYLGQADIELALAGHRMDVTVKKITAMAFLAGSAVAMSAIMGVNVRVPFQNFPNDGSPFRGLAPFCLLLLVMCTICVLVFAIGKRQKLL